MTDSYALQFRNALFHAVCRSGQLADRFDQVFAGRRQRNAGTGAVQQNDAEVLFESVHHMRDPGRRVPQFLRGFRKAARVDSAQKSFQLFGIHSLP